MFGLDDWVARFSDGTTVALVVAVAALGLFALCTAGSMAVVTTGWGLTLTRPRIQRSFDRLAPVLGVASLAFGTWYALGALSLAPYVF